MFSREWLADGAARRSRQRACFADMSADAFECVPAAVKYKAAEYEQLPLRADNEFEQREFELHGRDVAPQLLVHPSHAGEGPSTCMVLSRGPFRRPLRPLAHCEQISHAPFVVPDAPVIPPLDANIMVWTKGTTGSPPSAPPHMHRRPAHADIPIYEPMDLNEEIDEDFMLMPHEHFMKYRKKHPLFNMDAKYTGDGFYLNGKVVSCAMSSPSKRWCYTLRYDLGKQFVAYEHVLDKKVIRERYRRGLSGSVIP